MKTIAQIVSLEGQTEEITISELRSKPGEIFAQVALGKCFSISKSGVIIARITPPDKEFDLSALQQIRRISP